MYVKESAKVSFLISEREKEKGKRWAACSTSRHERLTRHAQSINHQPDRPPTTAVSNSPWRPDEDPPLVASDNHSLGATDRYFLFAGPAVHILADSPQLSR